MEALRQTAELTEIRAAEIEADPQRVETRFERDPRICTLTSPTSSASTSARLRHVSDLALSTNYLRTTSGAMTTNQARSASRRGRI